jgi:hypothetical protein
MPIYDYIGKSKDGKEVRGCCEADDYKGLVERVKFEGLFLIWSHERGPNDPAPERSHHAAPPVSTEKPADRRPIDFTHYPTRGLLGFIARHSKGAVTTKNQARVVALIGFLMLFGTITNMVYQLKPKKPPEYFNPTVIKPPRQRFQKNTIR